MRMTYETTRPTLRRAAGTAEEGTMRLHEIWQSTVGQKALAAVSGLLLWLWVIAHVLGNLTLFSGAADDYAATLRRAPGALWAVRAGLAGAAVVHIAAVTSLARAGRA